MSDTHENNMIWADSTSGRLLEIVDRRRADIGLDLSGLSVLTDARTEEDFVTILAAARAGAARIIAAGPLRATVRSAQVEAMIRRASAEMGLESRIDFTETVEPAMARQVDIIAVERQSSLIKPALLSMLPPSSVLAMLFDSRGAVSGGLDLSQRGAFDMQVAAVNIADPESGIAEFLAPLCLLQMRQAGLQPEQCRCLLLCDNEMQDVLETGLRAAGAQIVTAGSLDAVSQGPFEAVILAMTPSREYRLDLNAVSRLPELMPGGVVVQFWGDIDRSAARYFSVEIWPPVHPGRGQMGIRLSALGSEPVVAMRSGALLAAARMIRKDERLHGAERGKRVLATG